MENFEIPSSRKSVLQMAKEKRLGDSRPPSSFSSQGSSVSPSKGFESALFDQLLDPKDFLSRIPTQQLDFYPLIETNSLFS